MQPPPPAAEIDATGLRLGPRLHLSFQRHASPPGLQAAARPPPSLGLLPLGRDPRGGFLLPLAEGEAFWIGLDPGEGPPLRLEWSVALAAGGREAQPARSVAGPDRILAFGGGRTLARALVDRLDLAVSGATASLRLVDYATFTAASGQPAPAPLDPRAGYKGWRLP